MRGLGTLVNVATVVAGTGIGLLVGPRLPERLRTTVLDALGIITIGVGVASFLESRNAVFVVVSIVAGAVIGELLGIEDRLEGVGDVFRRRFERRRAGTNPTFVEGFVTASLTFCTGALTILGSLQDGISGDSQLLLVKAALDGVVAVAYTTVFGVGVGFSALTVLVLQGTVTAIGAVTGDSLLTERMVAELEATGGVMIGGIGLRLLDLRRVRVGSLLPALVIAPVLVGLFAG